MAAVFDQMCHYVVPALELNLLASIPADCPEPVHLEWINRGTDRHLQPMTVAMLVRTLASSNQLSESVKHLHASAGLRLRFASNHDRASFRSLFEQARWPGRSED
jgi:hypothetical protein